MSALGIAAIACAGVALARYAVGLPLLFRYLRRARVRAIPRGPTPPISLLKPVYGEDPALEENLVATLRQNYPEFEVLVCHERAEDPALRAVEAARRAVPDVAVRTVAGRDAQAANPKAAVLIHGEAHARHGIVAAADSDVRPDPLYLRDIANGLTDADAVSFAPVHFGMRTFWMRVMGLYVDTDAFLTILLAGRHVTTGATIGVRREALARIGGFRAVADAAADDHALGRALARSGCRLALARRAARVHAPGGDFGTTLRWIARWTRVVRSASPLVFWLSLPPAAAPPLLLAASVAAEGAGRALGLLLLLTLLRAVVAVIVDFRFCWDRSLVRALPLLPLLWIFEAVGWLSGVAGSTITWRGRRYRLHRGRATLKGS